MTRQDERVKYAMSFEGKGMENEELKDIIRLAILDGTIWADNTMIDKACKWLKLLTNLDEIMIEEFRNAMKE